MKAWQDNPYLRKAPVTLREWAHFALRWAIPLGLIVYLFDNKIADLLSIGLIAGAIFLSVVSNLFILLLFLDHRWQRMMTIVSIGMDFVLTLIAVSVSDVTMGWVGLVPVVVAGFYFGWMPGVLIGSILSISLVVLQIVQLDTRGPEIPFLLFNILMLMGGGPLAYFLGSDKSEISQIRSAMRKQDQATGKITRIANEYIVVLAEMTRVLSGTRLDPRSVLASAATFSVEALERVGVEKPIYAIILVFTETEEDGKRILQTVRSSTEVPLLDQKIELPGAQGIIQQALSTQRPVLNTSPASDPEVGQYSTLGKSCQTVLALPLRSGNESYGIMLIGASGENAFDETQVDMMGAIANQASASLSAARLYVSLLDQRDRMVDVEKIARAQLASELHDGPTQGVAAVSMRLNFIRKLMEKKPENALDELFKIEDLARKTTREMRHMLFELRPMALEDGLAVGLKQLAAKMEETYEQKVSIDVQPEAAGVLDAQITQILFSIATETANNARKHAQADLISIRTLLRDDNLVLEIADNGVGFDVQQALEAAKNRAGHLGLINLQERARFINGDLTIWSEPGHGSRTTVAIPLAELRRRHEEAALREESSRDMAVADA